MSLCKTEGIILRTRRQGETSKILNVYTRDFGKISLIAKGSRSLKSRNWGALEPFTQVAIVFYQKPGRDLQFLSQADIVRPLANLHTQLGKMMLAAMICELVERVESPEHVNPQLYRLFTDALEGLDNAPSGTLNLVRSFQLKLIGLLGYQPKLSECNHCGNHKFTGLVSFDMSSGGFLCHDCTGSGSNYLLISSSAINIMAWLQNVFIKESYRAKITKQVGAEIDAFLSSYLQYHIEGLGKLKTITAIEQISRSLTSNESI